MWYHFIVYSVVVYNECLLQMHLSIIHSIQNFSVTKSILDPDKIFGIYKPCKEITHLHDS